MTPLLQCQHNGKQLFISTVVIPLSRGEVSGEEGAGVELTRAGAPLGEDGSYARLWSVHLHHKLAGLVRML